MYFILEFSFLYGLEVLFGVSRAGFSKLIYKIAPFQKFEKKSPPIFAYFNFPLEGTLFSQKSRVKNLILDWYFLRMHFFAVFKLIYRALDNNL